MYMLGSSVKLWENTVRPYLDIWEYIKTVQTGILIFFKQRTDMFPLSWTENCLQQNLSNKKTNKLLLFQPVWPATLATLLEKFWRILSYLTNDTIAKLNVT